MSGVDGRQPGSEAMTDAHRQIRTEEVPIDEYLEIPDILGGREGDYILQVSASFDSLAILEGDYLVVRPIDEPEKGALAVAVDGSEGSPLTVVRGAGDLPPGAKVIGAVIGMIRKVYVRSCSALVSGDYAARRHGPS